MNLSRLYNESISFKIYVDRYCKEHKATKTQAYNDIVVKQYAFHIMSERKNNGKRDNHNKR